MPSFIGYREGALLIFKVIHQISRSHGPEKCQFCSLDLILGFSYDNFS